MCHFLCNPRLNILGLILGNKRLIIGLHCNPQTKVQNGHSSFHRSSQDTLIKSPIGGLATGYFNRVVLVGRKAARLSFLLK